MSAKPRILVVDDEPQLTRVLLRSLTSKGYDVHIASDGEVGLQTFRDWTPSLVITDLAMPNISGLELMKIAKSRYPGLSVIVMTMMDTPYHRKAALTAGADAFVAKSTMDTDLVPTIANLQHAPAERH